MKKNLNKSNIILYSIIIISLISEIFLGIKFAILTFLILFLIYLIITKKHYIKVFKGMKAYKLEDYNTALEFYRDAAMSNWCNGPIISNYLICELKYGKPSLAKEYVNENLKNKNIKPNELLNLEVTKAIVNWKTNSKEEAIKSLEELLKHNKNIYIYETLTSFLLCSNRFIEANKYITEAMEFYSNNNIILSNYAEVCYKLGNYKESEKHFNTLIQKNIKFFEPYYYCALMENKNGNFEKALGLLQTAETLNESLVSLINHKVIQQTINSVMINSLNNID